VVPETVQTLVVELAKVTVVVAESLAAPRENVPAPPLTQVWVPGGVQVMVWTAPRILMLIGLPGVRR
jgi:hypothetical protein